MIASISGFNNYLKIRGNAMSSSYDILSMMAYIEASFHPNRDFRWKVCLLLF